MALTQDSLVSKMEKHLKLQGYTKVEDEDNGRGYRRYSMPFLRALSAAVIEEIQENARVQDKGSECSGEWSIQ
ncbi:hypothetical protein B6S12_10160 [Helicobacter valdiviensis]|uniref:Uncharacterized protein n=1 Tax=Helicobacter valdiviensis TaxID=1458358 RepID=A0A2W6MTK2_9HELI|nr:hypothetical protein [Helicobacter valdiviensis]PZT47239.1 hypothetical protein B6S12_10160 [Helicobacter valdiviensis]